MNTAILGSKSTYFNMKQPDCEVGKYLLVTQGDSEGSKIFRVIIRPILLTFDLFTLLDVRYHDNSVCMLLPYHPPVINKCAPDWTYMHMFAIIANMFDWGV